MVHATQATYVKTHVDTAHNHKDEASTAVLFLPSSTAATNSAFPQPRAHAPKQKDNKQEVTKFNKNNHANTQAEITY